MKGNSRFLKSIIASAKEFEGQLPWSRGASREAAIARRRNPRPSKRSA